MNGRLDSHAATAGFAKDIQHLATLASKEVEDYRTKLQKGFQGREASNALAEDEARLRELCRDCNETAGTLLKRLDQLRVQDISRTRIWKSLQQALLSLWSKAEIENLKRKLAEFQNAIDSRVLLYLRYVYIHSFMYLFGPLTGSPSSTVNGLTLLRCSSLNISKNLAARTNRSSQLYSKSKIPLLKISPKIFSYKFQRSVSCSPAPKWWLQTKRIALEG